MIVYRTTNLVNGKFYIGKDQKNDPSYLGSGRRFKLAVKKYGKENFQKEILEYCTADNIDEREIYWIKVTNAIQEGYNISTGGTGGDLGPVGNAKRAKSLKGKKQTQVTIEKRKEALKDREHTWGDKISESMTGKTWKQSRPRSEEHRQKLSKANTGKTHSKETIAKLSEKQKGKSPGNVGKFKHNGKFYDYETYCKLVDQPRRQLNYDEITKLRDQGKLWREIAELYGYHSETIRHWFKRFGAK